MPMANENRDEYLFRSILGLLSNPRQIITLFLNGDLPRFASLFVSGIVSSLFLVLLASQRIHWIPVTTVVFVLSFLQWYALGMTVAKIGIDQVAFAVQSRDASIRFDISKFCLHRATPISAAMSSLMAFVFSPSVAVIAFLVIVLDIYALAATAELNARKIFLPAIVANLINYPLFLTIGIIGSIWFDSKVVFLTAFLLSTIVRYLWIMMQHRQLRIIHVVEYTSVLEMMFQQFLNFMLFRLDQLLLPLVLTLGLIDGYRGVELVYFFKFPELVSSAVLIMGLFIFPALVPSVSWSDARFNFRMESKHLLAASFGCVALFAGFVIYAAFWTGSRSSLVEVGAMYLVNAILVLPVNALIYFHLGQGHSRELIRSSFLGIISGGIVCLLLWHSDNMGLLGIVVPLQLLVMIVFTWVLPIGITRPLYSSVRGTGE